MRKEIQFLIAVGGIYTCYFKVGLLEEYIYNNNFGTLNAPSPQFKYSSELVLLITLFFNLLCTAMIYYKNVQFVCTTFEGMQLGFLNFFSMIASLTALQYVSFPLQALTKSCKILSVLLVGLVLGNQNFQKQQIICGVIITIGIFAFNMSEGNNSIKETSSIFGIALLIGSLFADGFLASVQSSLKTKSIEQWEMGFHISFYSCIGSLIMIIIEGGYYQFFEFIQIYQESIYGIISLTIFSVFGQVFIYYCINCFSPRVLSIITTTRKFFTVILSIIVNHHNLMPKQWCAIVLVATGVGWELIKVLNRKSTNTEANQYDKIELEEFSVKNLQNDLESVADEQLAIS